MSNSCFHFSWVPLLLLAHGKAVGLNACLSPVTAQHWAPRASQYHRSRLWVSQSKSIYTTPAEIRLLSSRRERWIFDNYWVVQIIHWLTPPIILPWWFEPKPAIWSERLAKSPYQKNTSPAVGLEPAFYRLQGLAFYQLPPLYHWLSIKQVGLST